MASLEDRLDQDVEGWRPNPGDSLTGVVVSVDTRPSDYGDDYPLIEVEKPDGTVVAVHGFHTVLKNELARLRPAPGDQIGIKYSGKTEGKRLDAKGKAVEFEKYRVIVEKNTGPVESPDWDSMKSDAESQLSELEPF